MEGVSSISPTVSVIITTYNLENYIQRSLESVINQTFKDLEIIVVDDGSSDTTVKKVSEILISNNVSYNIIVQKNSGVSVARNNGLKIAKGKYIKFLDGDDVLEKNCIQNLVKTMEKNEEYDLTYGKQHVVTTNGNFLIKYEEMYPQPWSEANSLTAIKDFLTGLVHISVNSALFKRETILRNNLLFTKGATYGEDNEFIAKYIFFSRKVAFSEKASVMATYRKDSSTKQPSLRAFHNVGCMKRLKKFFSEKSTNCEDLKDLIRIFDLQVIPSAYAWTIGNLAFNGFNYTRWIKIIRHKEIRKQISNFKILSTKTKYYKQLNFGRYLFLASPSLFYLTMRVIKFVYDMKTKRM